MALSDNTKLVLTVLGTGVTLSIAIIGGIGWAVTHLTGQQTEMENRLSANITTSENRLTQHIDQVDKRLTGDLNEVGARLVEQITKLDTGLRAVEGETATLAGVEARLTKTIESSETRLSQGQQGVEKRLTAQIDKIDDRLLQVEGESARLAAIMKSRSIPAQWIWTAGKGALAEMMAGGEKFASEGGKVQAVANPEAMDSLKGSDMKIEFFMSPFSVINPYFTEASGKAYIEGLEKHLAALKAAQRAGEGDEDTSTKSE